MAFYVPLRNYLLVCIIATAQLIHTVGLSV